MHHGATDYVLKQRLARLGPAVRRALQETARRQQLEQAEGELRRSEANYREIFNATHEAIVVHDANTGAILDANRTAEEMYGYSAAELCRMTGGVTKGEAPAMRGEGLRRIRLAVTAGPQIFEWQSRKKSGEFFWMEVALRAITIGGAGRVLAVVRDITERKRAEEALRASELRFHSVWEHSVDGMRLTDADGTIVAVNEAFCRLVGLRREELEAQPFTASYADPA